MSSQEYLENTLEIKMLSKLLCFLFFCFPFESSTSILRVSWIRIYTWLPAWASSWAWRYHGPNLPCATFPSGSLWVRGDSGRQVGLLVVVSWSALTYRV